MKIALGQINSIIGDFEANCRKMVDYARKAEKQGADLIVFPEMSLCGYPPMDLLDHVRFTEENKRALRSLQRELPPEMGVVVGYVDTAVSVTGKALRNVVSLIHQREIVHTQAKTLLPSYDVFDESRYFEPSEARKSFSFKGQRIGMAVCEDIWWETGFESDERYPVDPVRDLLDQGVEILLVPSASPFYTGKQGIRGRLLEKIGKQSGVPVVYVNAFGANDSLVFDGASMVSGEKGECVVRGKSFEEDLLYYDTGKSYDSIALKIDKYGDLYRALVLGIRDYLAKCGFSKVHLGLSGGIDSALVAVLAREAVGPGNLKCFGMPSRYSSDHSLSDAQKLSENLGVPFEVIEIEPMFQSFLQALKPSFAGRDFDVAEENIQARIRGTLMMGYSNKWGSLVLTTGNKSELATGYCTLYGDMAGGLAVIGDLYKTEVFELCRYINREQEIIPNHILVKPPSAELRPDQKDEDSLPPYEVLDGILKLYLEDNCDLEDIVAAGYERETVSFLLRLVCLNEYKRRQAPPVLKVSRRAFGTGRRMPMARRIFEHL